MQSSPPKPKMMSGSAVPVMQSEPAVPKQGPPKHVTGVHPGKIAVQVAAHCALAPDALQDALKATAKARN